MSERNIDRSFLGTGWSFPPEFNKRVSGVTMVSEDDDIRESLRILLLTSPGERTMYPAYGCGLKALIFDTISESTITEITDVIERAVLFFEPRITLDSVEVDTETMYDGLIKILLRYTIRATNSRSNMVYPFYFREGTNLAF
jgi:phage baseplate assembly protein W